jgi:hypothetical protein
VAFSIDPALIGSEFDVVEHPAVSADELIAFARALGATEPEYIQPGPDLRAHPTWCVRYHGRRPYPDRLPNELDFRRGMDAGKDVEFGVPIRPGDAITVRSTLHDVYEKTGRSGSMIFLVHRMEFSNQRGELVSIVDWRFLQQPDPD